MKHAWIALALAAAGCSAESVAAPPPVPSASYDRACKADRDCVLTDLSIAGKDLCCPSCTSTALSTTGFKALTATCQAPNKNGCPPLGCMMPVMHATCAGSVCTAVTTKQ